MSFDPKIAIRLGASLLALATVAPVHAQQAQTAAGATGQGQGIGEIVVTAQRRAENIQNVPVAVTALTADTLAKNDIRDLSRVEVLTPGFSFGKSGSDARPAIRGVRTENVGTSGDPSIGFYVDNIYQSRASQANVPFVDVARVEVQRGPQGTLYGRNTFGGNITLESAAPNDKLGAGFDAIVGSYGRVSLSGFVNTPLSDDLQVRIAGLRETMNGYIKGVDSAHDIGNRDTTYLRASLRYAPRGSGFEALLRYSYWLDKGAGNGAFGYRVGGIYVNPTTGALDINGTALAVNPKVLDGVADVAGVDRGTPITGGPLTYTGNVILVQRLQQHQASANLSYDFGPVIIRSITGYTSYSAFRNADNNFLPAVGNIDFQNDALHTFSQEVQLASKASQRLNWIVGGFFMRDNIYRGDFYSLPETNLNGTSINAHPLTKSYAVFGQASYWILPDVFRVTGGLRYTSDNKVITRDISTIVNANVTAIAPNINTATGQPYAPLDFTFKKTTWRVNAEYHPSRQNMIYATVSTGFRSGGFNSGNFTNPAIPGAFQPETVTAYEIGSKNRFLDDRLQVNVSAYINEFRNLQVQNQFLIPATGGGFTTSSAILNAASARARGIELEVQARPTPALNIAFSATVMDAKYRDYTGAPAPALYTTPAPSASNPKGGYDLSGNRVPYQPNYKFTGVVGYDIDLGTAGRVTPSATVLVSGDYYLTDFNKSLDYQKGFAKLDLRLGWASADDRLSAEAFVNNVTDAVTLNRATFGSAGVNQNYDAPRMFGARFGARF